MASKEKLRKKFVLLRKKKYFSVEKKFFKPLIELISKKNKKKISLYYPSNYEVDTKKLFERYDLVINIDAEIVENLMENLNNIEINFNKNSSVDGIKKGSKNYSDYKNNIQTLNTKLNQDI